LRDGHHDGKLEEAEQLIFERAKILVGKGVVEIFVPIVEHDAQADPGQIQRDDRAQQGAGDPPLRRAPVGRP